MHLVRLVLLSVLCISGCGSGQPRRSPVCNYIIPDESYITEYKDIDFAQKKASIDALLDSTGGFSVKDITAIFAWVYHPYYQDFVDYLASNNYQVIKHEHDTYFKRDYFYIEIPKNKEIHEAFYLAARPGYVQAVAPVKQ